MANVLRIRTGFEPATVIDFITIIYILSLNYHYNQRGFKIIVMSVVLNKIFGVFIDTLKINYIR